MDVTRRSSTNVEAGKKPGLGLAEPFQHFRKFPTAEFREDVRPNFDTLYSLCTARRPKQSATRKHPNELPYP